MIPILYGSVSGSVTSAEEYYLGTQGIGPLPDVIDGVVIEERNGQYELEMTYPITGKHYSDISISCFIKVVPFVNGDPQLFEIYRMTKPINGQVKIYGRHISYRLSYNTVTPFSLTNCTAAQAFTGLKNHAVEDCAFTFETDFTGTAASFKIGEPQSFRSCLGGTDGSILDRWSGEYEWDNFTIKFHRNRGQDNNVSLMYGKNITDLTQDENIENTITGIVPFWKGYDENSQEVIVSCGPVYSSNADRFPFRRTVPHDYSMDFSEAPTVQLLQQTAEAWVVNNKIGEPAVDLTVSFIQLADTTEYKNLKLLETVNLCDTVHVEFPELGVSATSKVIKTEYDFLKDRYKSITLGSTKASNLVKTLQEIVTPDGIEEITKNQSILEQTVAAVTEAIRGSSGGYVKMLDTNNDGHTDEIVILDANSGGILANATDVWRWNKDGLGHSSNGYMGPFTTAITADGQIVANFITAGVLQGIRIIAELGSIGGWTINSSKLTSNNGNVSIEVGPNQQQVTINSSNYQQYVDKITNIALGSAMFVYDDVASTDLNCDGAVDSLDLALATRGGTVSPVTNTYNYSAKFSPSSDNKMIVLTKEASTPAGNASIKTIIGAGEIETDYLFAKELIINHFDINDVNTAAHLMYSGLIVMEDGIVRLRVNLSGVYFYDSQGNLIKAYLANSNLQNLEGLSLSIKTSSSGNSLVDLTSSSLLFKNSSNVEQSRFYANPSDNAKLLGSTTSSSWSYISVTNMQMYRAFVLNACRGSGNGVMVSTYIPYEQARLCTSSSVETWAHSAQNGNYSGRCYFDFTNSRIYLISSGYTDCVIKIYGIT